MVTGADQDVPGGNLPQRRASPWPWVLLALIITPLLALIVFAVLTLGGVAATWSTVQDLLAGRLEVKPNPTSVVTQVQQLNRLETTSYTVEKVIEGGQSQGSPLLNLLLGDRLLFIAHGQVIAGVDLTRLGPEDVSISQDGRSVTMRLPQAQILSYKLDEEQSRVYDRQTGILTRGDPQLETKVRQAAELQVLQAACQGGILAQANNSARAQVRALLEMTRFSEVHFASPSTTGPTGCEPQE